MHDMSTCVGIESILSAGEMARYSTKILRIYHQAKVPVTDSTLLAGWFIILVFVVTVSALVCNHALLITHLYSSSECD